MSKKILIPVIALTLIGVLGFVSVKKAYAEVDVTNLPPLIQKIIERFNLNPNEVMQVVEEERIQRQEEHKALLEEKLTQAVADGKITEDQKAALLEKLTEMPQNRGDKKGMLETHEEFRTWAEENGIDLSELQLGPKGFGIGRFGPKGFAQ